MSKMSEEVAPRQRAALERLVGQGVLTREQLVAVFGALEGDRDHRSARSVLWEVLGYLGGALVVGGAALLLGMSWDDLSRSARVSLLVAATLVLLGAGIIMGGGPRGVRSLATASPSSRTRIVAVLFALASGTAAMSVGSALDAIEELAATSVGLLVAVLGYLVVPSVPGLLVAGGFSVGVVLAGVNEWFSSSVASVTVGLIALGAAWVVLALTDKLVDGTVGLAGGTAIALAGAQWPVSSDQPWWGYGATVVIALICFAGYVYRHAAVLMVLGVLGITVAIPEAIWDWTDGAVSGPLTVLIVGLVFLVASGIGLRLHRTAQASRQD